MIAPPKRAACADEHSALLDEQGKCLLCAFPSLDPGHRPDYPGERADHDAPAPDPLRAEYRRLLARAAKRYRDNFWAFVRAAWPVINPTQPLEENWHLQVICDHVQATIEELEKARRDPKYRMRWQNVLFNVPPRSGKTVIIGIMLPAWIWLRDPGLKYRYVSANPRMVSFTARATRDLVTNKWYRTTFAPEWTIRPDIDSIGLFATTARGERYSTSIGADIVGEGTDIIVVDDPTDPEDAHSEAMREKVKVKWNESIANRVNSPRACARLGIMQRLHEDDWSALVLTQGWRHVLIPMLREVPKVDENGEVRRACRCGDCAAEQTFLGWRDPRNDNESLHPDRFPDDFLATEKVRLGSYGWAGQMQQRPSPEGGGVFKHEHFKRIDPDDLPRFEEVGIFCDLTFGGDDVGSSRNALMLAGRKGSKRYVLEVIAAVMHVGQIKANIIDMYDRAVKLSRRVVVVVEKAAVGASIVSELRRGVLHGDPPKMRTIQGIIEWVPGTGNKSRDKKSRAMSVQPFVEAGDVVLLKGAPWLDEYLEEMGAFDRGVYDDQVDASSMMLDYWRGSGPTIDQLITAYGRRRP